MNRFTAFILSTLLVFGAATTSIAQTAEGTQYINIDGQWVLVGPDGKEVVFDYTHEVVRTVEWGKYVPVFNFREAFFDARDRQKFQDIVCKLEIGNKVIFQPELDSGTGELSQADNNHPGCAGWTDARIFEEIEDNEN